MLELDSQKPRDKYHDAIKRSYAVDWLNLFAWAVVILFNILFWLAMMVMVVLVMAFV